MQTEKTYQRSILINESDDELKEKLKDFKFPAGLCVKISPDQKSNYKSIIRTQSDSWQILYDNQVKLQRYLESVDICVSIRNLDRIDNYIWNVVMNSESNEFSRLGDSLIEKIKNSLNVIEKAFEMYSIDASAIAYNGGKDSSVVMFLLYASFLKFYKNSKPNILYIEQSDEFTEMRDFVNSSLQEYGYQYPVSEDSKYLLVFSGPIKEVLSQVCTKDPSFKAVFMGTRQNDHRDIEFSEFQQTDSDWPDLMRINPILNWTNQDIWTFLRTLEVPYCQLYDQGYTSIGSQTNTVKNPLLRYFDENGWEKYQPAYSLCEENAERAGRKMREQ